MRKTLTATVTVLFALTLSGTLMFLKKADGPSTTLALNDVDKMPVAETIDPVAVKRAKLAPMSARKQKVKGVEGKDNPNLFAEWHRGIRTRAGETAPDYALNYQMTALLKARNVKSASQLAKLQSSSALDWVERGPGNVGGRTRGILVDPSDSSYGTWIVGSVGGGVWKTTDSGQTWAHLTEGLPNLATSTLAWAPDFPNYIYAGTGEGFGNVDQIDGSGIWMTSDGGATWNQIISTATNPDFDNVMRMVVDPADPMTLVAATTPGFNSALATASIYRTTDAGATWTEAFEVPGAIEHLIANPENFQTQYASINGVGVVKSVDGGVSWSDASEGIGAVGRLELAIAPTDTNTIYASAQGGPAGSVLYSSTDGGASWFSHSDATGNDVHWLRGQGWYDNTIAVNPYDANKVFVGGVNLFELTMVAGSDTTDEQVTGIDFENTSSFLGLVNFGGAFAGGGIDFGEGFHGLATGVTADDFTTVEVRFGPGKSQKGHRFLFAGGFQYPYQDYVDVPFEVWDTENNQQLMVSWRDDENNGVYELEDRASDLDGSGIDREYLFIHAVPYDAANPDTNIAKVAGEAFKNTFVVWPEAPAGTGVIDLTTLTEDATLRIKWGRVVTRRLSTEHITDAYDDFGGDPKGLHVDLHNLVPVKTNEANQEFRLIIGNDGGVAFTDDNGATFLQTGIFQGRPGSFLKGYNTSQFYGIDKVNGQDRYIGGTQDNGSFLSPVDADDASEWAPLPSGDGFEAVAHYGDVNKMLESSQFNSIRRSLDGGATWTFAGPPEQNGDPFFTKIADSKQDPDLVFAIGGSGVWRSDNFADDWTLTPMTSDGWNGTSSFSQVKISLANPQIVWTGRNMTDASSPYVSTDGGLTFTATNVLGNLARITGLETHPTEDSTAFVVLSARGTPKVVRTQDLGQTWEDLSGFAGAGPSSNGFPDVATFSLLVMPFNTDIIWAGTEIGLFESTDDGASWAFADNGVPAAAIYDMIIVNDEVVIATHGRGVWTTAMAELAGYEPPPAILSPRIVEGGGGADGIVGGTILLPSAYDSSAFMVDGAPFEVFPANQAGDELEREFQIPFEGDRDTVSVSLAAWKDAGTFRSPAFEVELFSLGAARAFYTSDFNEANEDFELGEFTIGTGFANGALESLHPYPAPGAGEGNSIAQLKFPIIVNSDNSTILFDEIAIIEEGDPGTVFGDDNFWDYVTVEGSNDNGVTWTPLVDGYDARADQAWLAAFRAGAAGDASMYRPRSLDLQPTFASGEEVLIRFRLFWDAFANGWGWAIDNLSIQTDPVSVKGGSQLPTSFALEQNYPNPFNPETSINYDLPKESVVTLQVYNVVGQKVRNLVFEQKQKAGRYSLQWDGRDDGGQPVSTGLYFYRIKAGDFVNSHKMTLLK